MTKQLQVRSHGFQCKVAVAKGSAVSMESLETKFECCNTCVSLLAVTQSNTLNIAVVRCADFLFKIVVLL